MKNAIAKALLAAALSATIAGCAKEEPPPPPPPPPKKEEPPPPPPKPTVPEYAPVGEGADLKKSAAADITADNALAKATEVEKTLDGAITELEAKAAAKPAKKK